MSVNDRLMAGEEVLSSFGPFYATSRRVILYKQKRKGEEFKELPYHRITSIELVKVPRHNIMISGTILVLSAIFLTLTGLIRYTTVPVVIIGLVLILYGSLGKEGYYQILIRDAARGEERAWRIQFWRSGSFIATIRSIIGQIPDF